MQDFLGKLEILIQKYLKEKYLPPHRARTNAWNFHDVQFFSPGADLLSTSFTEDRSSLPKNYLNKKEYRSAYLLYFLLMNVTKSYKTFEWIKPFLRTSSIKVLDVGCGPATTAFAANEIFKDDSLAITGLEQNINISKDGLELWKRWNTNPNHRLSIHNMDLSSRNLKNYLKGKKFDIAIAANFLSELPQQNQQENLELLLNHSDFVIVIEPALQRVTRNLMELRNFILQQESAKVIAPCLHSQACPMLKHNKRDWCHFYISWKCPILIRQVDALIGNKHDYLKMAYMIFRTSWKMEKETKKDNLYWRVVSSSLFSNGKKELLLCGENGKLLKICRLDKDVSPTNEDFDKARRGDVVLTPETDRLPKNGTFKIVKTEVAPHQTA